jgi:hypothetical protein
MAAVSGTLYLTSSGPVGRQCTMPASQPAGGNKLKRTGGRYALATMCIGGGQGIVAIFERV